MKKILYVIFLFSSFNSSGQITPDKLQRVIMDHLSIESPRFKDEKSVASFYEKNNHELTWMRSQDNELRSELLTILGSADDYGMDHKDYQNSIVNSLISGWIPDSAMDTILTDFRLTDAAIHFFSDLKNGKEPSLRYKGIEFKPDNISIASILATNCSVPGLQSITKLVESNSREYVNAKNLLLHFNRIMGETGFTEVTIKSNKADTTNLPLVTRLFQLGVLDSIKSVDQKTLIQKIQKAQKMLNVLNDGKLGTYTIAALNIPIWQRKEELKTAMNYIRWFEAMRKGGSLGLLNIPSTNFFLYSNDTISLFSKIIAGKPSTPTPTLSSKITEVIVYPYWHVPFNIATRELLPSIQRNIRFLEQGNFEVLNKQGMVVDPYKINWQSLSTSNFPYSIRQSTGCDNALGVLKFNFYNPFTVYLHDTPGRGLFFMHKRFFSHGCMRVEKPVELASILLKEKASGIESLTKQCLKDQKPKTIQLPQPLPLIVFYSTAWYNESGEIQFFEDVYHKLSFEKPAIAKL
ncbi:MAG: L,D-transpeptidase scaffold domain-containing protein [Flavisolibacter sp.]